MPESLLTIHVYHYGNTTEITLRPEEVNLDQPRISAIKRDGERNRNAPSHNGENPEPGELK